MRKRVLDRSALLLAPGEAGTPGAFLFARHFAQRLRPLHQPPFFFLFLFETEYCGTTHA